MKSFNLPAYIVFEDEDYLALNKPAGLASLADRSAPGQSISELLTRYYPDPQLCHRLDKETSGIILIAKTPQAYRHASLQFQNRQVTKIYHAVTGGCHRLQNLEINLPIHNAGNKNVVISRSKGKPSQTFVTTLSAFRNYTLLSCTPVTGRMHQIRVHLASQGMPIVADALYGGTAVFLSKLKPGFKASAPVEQPLMGRVALHAYSLTFNTLQNTPVTIQAPYPKDFDVFIKKLAQYNGMV